MTNLIAIMGSSGTGKSTSLRNLNPKETCIINVSKKPLPFRNAKQYKEGIKEGGNMTFADNPNQVIQILKYVGDKFKNIIIDDAGYLMGFDVMRRSNEKGYEKWTELAAAMFNVIDTARNLDNVNVIFTFHTEKGEDGLMKIKTAGKLLDNAIYIDGLFTFVLVAKADFDITTNEVKYKFVTRNDGYATAKSPMDCLEPEMDNDLQLVLDKIVEYYN